MIDEGAEKSGNFWGKRNEDIHRLFLKTWNLLKYRRFSSVCKWKFSIKTHGFAKFEILLEYQMSICIYISVSQPFLINSTPKISVIIYSTPKYKQIQNFIGQIKPKRGYKVTRQVTTSSSTFKSLTWLIGLNFCQWWKPKFTEP